MDWKLANARARESCQGERDSVACNASIMMLDLFLDGFFLKTKNVKCYVELPGTMRAYNSACFLEISS